MDPTHFLADLERLPRTLAAVTAETYRWSPPRSSASEHPARIVLAGMGSSYFAARMVATRLRAHGVLAVAERSSVAASFPPAADLVVVGISASGTSAETLDFLSRYVAAGTTTVALTNTPSSAIADLCGSVVDLAAAPEEGGVACRSFHHTVVALMALAEAYGVGVPGGVAALAHRASEAAADLLDRRDAWLGELADRLDGPHGVWMLAPEERLGSALQGALMVREGPRRPADACETGDWSHVDVYLTKTLDYRALVFAGSAHEAAAAEWMTARHSTVVSVGGAFPGSAMAIRYRHDDDPLVAMCVEALVPALLAAHWWRSAE